jgi:hypothetical protein
MVLCHPPLLDATLLEWQSSCFVTLDCNSSMHDCNPTIRMWRWMANSQILKLKMFKFFKVVQLISAMVLGSVEDERTFLPPTLMKSQLRNWLTTHLDLVVKTYAQNFFTPKFPILHHYHWVKWRKILQWVGAISLSMWYGTLWLKFPNLVNFICR